MDPVIRDKKEDNKKGYCPCKTECSDKRKEKPLLEVISFFMDQPEWFMYAFCSPRHTFSPILTARYFFDTASEMRLNTKVIRKRIEPTPNRA